jgi:hypothetical protein
LSITRNAVESDVYRAEQKGPVTHRAQMSQAVAAPAKHHREIAVTRLGVMAGVARAQPDGSSQSAAVSPTRSATPASFPLPACEISPVLSAVYRAAAPIAHHLQGEPPKVGPSGFDTPRNPC